MLWSFAGYKPRAVSRRFLQQLGQEFPEESVADLLPGLLVNPWGRRGLEQDHPKHVAEVRLRVRINDQAAKARALLSLLGSDGQALRAPTTAGR